MKNFYLTTRFVASLLVSLLILPSAFAQELRHESTSFPVEMDNSKQVSFIAENNTEQICTIVPFSLNFGDERIEYITISSQGWCSFDGYTDEDVVQDLKEGRLNTIVSPYTPLLNNTPTGTYIASYQRIKIRNSVCLVINWKVDEDNNFQVIFDDKGRTQFRYSKNFTRDSEKYITGVASKAYFTGTFPIIMKQKPLEIGFSSISSESQQQSFYYENLNLKNY